MDGREEERGRQKRGALATDREIECLPRVGGGETARGRSCRKRYEIVSLSSLSLFLSLSLSFSLSLSLFSLSLLSLFSLISLSHTHRVRALLSFYFPLRGGALVASYHLPDKRTGLDSVVAMSTPSVDVGGEAGPTSLLDAAIEEAKNEIEASEDERRRRFLENNIRARSQLRSQLSKEQEKQRKLRQEMGSDAERLFSQWREEQEAGQGGGADSTVREGVGPNVVTAGVEQLAISKTQDGKEDSV